MSYTELLPRHPRLGRHIEHDPRSWLYQYRRALPITSVQHTSYIGVLDQGNLGSCTGNAAVGCLGYAPFWATLPEDGFELSQALAVSVYSQATRLDEFPGEYPPDDTGSSGLGVAKALKARGLISGYRWMFTFLDTLGALMERPVIIGSRWYESMFNPDPDGLVTAAGQVAGGHEYILDGWDNTRGLATLRNSWGNWGPQAGRFYMTGATLARLLGEDGDAVLFTPANEPAPSPTPPTPLPQGCLTWLLKRSWRP